MDDKDIEAFLIEASSEEIRYLFKNFLQILEEIKEEHDSVMSRLYENFPEMSKVLNTCDYFNDRKLSRLRKRVLDIGNDAIRKNNGHVERICLNLQFKK